MRNRILIGCILLWFAGRCAAQEDLFPLMRRKILTTELVFQTWRIQGDNFPVSQVALPLMLGIPINEQIQLTFTHIPAYSWRSTVKLSGLSDTWAQGNYMAKNERWMVNAGLGVPTGKTRLNNEAFGLTTGLLSRSIFRFRLPVYGQGFSAKAGGMIAYPIGTSVVLGLGGQFQLYTSYKPVQYSYTYRSGNETVVRNVEQSYRPGNAGTVQAGADIQVGSNTKLMLDAQYTHYGRDMLEDQQIYMSGGRWIVDAGFFYQYNQQYLTGKLTFRQKGKHQYLSGIEFQEAEKRLDVDGGTVREWRILFFGGRPLLFEKRKR